MDATLDRATLEGAGFVEEADGDLLALAVALRRAPCERTATRLTLAVDRLPATEASARALAVVAEELKPLSQADADGRWCFEVVVEKWLSFGYPWALELPPELLDQVQQRRAETGSNAWAFVTLVSAVLAGCWYVFLLTAVSTRGHSIDVERLVVGGGALGSLGWLFALLRTMATAHLVDRAAIERAGRRLKRLGQVMWLAPTGVAGLAFIDLEAAFIVGALMAPVSITGAAARLSARRLRLSLR